MRLLGDGADTGLVVAGAEYAVLVDAAHRVGVPHARLGGLIHMAGAGGRRGQHRPM